MDETTEVAPAQPTLAYTWVLIIGALVLLWLLGGVAFRSVRQ